MTVAWDYDAVSGVVADLRRILRETVAGVVPRGARVALLDFPNHGNVGDSAIWLGELVMLRELGARLCYVASQASFRADELRRLLGPSGIVLLHGGGNFGDLWPKHHRHRLALVQELHDLPIVQLPQSICFQDPKGMEHTGGAIRHHRRFTMLVRDRNSLVAARDALGLSAVLCPDAAFALAPIPRPGAPSQPVVWLSREDHEAPSEPVASHAGASREDWAVEPAGVLHRAGAVVEGRPNLPQGAVQWTFRALARTRLRRGQAMIGRGRVLVTNRLHAQLLAMMMGVPHIVSDTRQGKLGAFFQTWLADRLPMIWSDSEAAALDRGLELAGAIAPQPAQG